MKTVYNVININDSCVKIFMWSYIARHLGPSALLVEPRTNYLTLLKTWFVVNFWQVRQFLLFINEQFLFTRRTMLIVKTNWKTMLTVICLLCGSFIGMSRLMTKSTKWHVRPAKTQISLGIHPVWLESLLSAWRKLGSLATHWAHSEGSDQTGRMPRLIWVFAGRIVILLVLSWDGSDVQQKYGRSALQLFFDG